MWDGNFWSLGCFYKRNDIEDKFLVIPMVLLEAINEKDIDSIYKE